MLHLSVILCFMEIFCSTKNCKIKPYSFGMNIKRTKNVRTYKNMSRWYKNTMPITNHSFVSFKWFLWFNYCTWSSIYEYIWRKITNYLHFKIYVFNFLNYIFYHYWSANRGRKIPNSKMKNCLFLFVLQNFEDYYDNDLDNLEDDLDILLKFGCSLRSPDAVDSVSCFQVLK